MVNHWLNIYQRPAQGSDFFRRYACYNYQHTISALGGFDTAQCDLATARADAEDFFANQLGARVAVFVDSSLPVWEGFINRITMDIGNLSYTYSLDEMYNDVSVVYNAPQISGEPQYFANLTNTQSINRFGRKQGRIEAFVLRGTNTGRISNLRNTIVAIQAFPQASTIFAGGERDAALLNVEMLGYHHALDWTYNNSDNNHTTLFTASNTIIQVLAGISTPTYFDPSDTSVITANSAFSMPTADRTGLTRGEFIRAIVEAGDGNGRWVYGIERKDYFSETWRFYYRPPDQAIRYVLRSDDHRVKTPFGQVVEPYRVGADGRAQIADVLVAWDGLGDDPRDFYIENVRYDGNSQSVQLTSTDDITAEAVFGLGRYYPTRGKRFGSPRRQAFS